MARLEFSRKVRASIIARAKGKCEACGASLKPREGEVDHILPDALGGRPEASNGRLICTVCHKAKTAGDVRRIRKADRQRDKSSGAVRPSSALSRKEPKQRLPLTKIAVRKIDVFGRPVSAGHETPLYGSHKR